MHHYSNKIAFKLTALHLDSERCKGITVFKPNMETGLNIFKNPEDICINISIKLPGTAHCTQQAIGLAARSMGRKMEDQDH